VGTTYLNGIPTETGAFIIEGASSLLDDIALGVGSASPASFLWETADDNANEFIINLPAGGAVDVPVIAIGQGIKGVDLGLYNGVVDPRIALFGIGARTTGTILEFRKARGTIAAPTAITTGDDLGSITAYGCVANGEYVKAAAIVLDSEGTIATTRLQGIIRFQTGTNAAPSVFADRLTIDSDYVTVAGNLTASAVLGTYLRGGATTSYLESVVSDTAAILFKMNDAGVGGVEIARMQAAADPYFQIGCNHANVSINTVTDGLVLQMAPTGAAAAAGQGFGMSWKIGNDVNPSQVEERGSIDLVLQTATNAAEDASYIVQAMVNGAMATVLSVGGYAGVSKLGFYAAAPVAKAGAYTQTYATADKTHAAVTQSTPPAGGTGATEGAYDTAANRDLMIASITAGAVDLLDLKQLVNALIDDLQAVGLVG